MEKSNKIKNRLKRVITNDSLILIKAFATFSEGQENVKLLLVGGNENNLGKYRLLVNELKIVDKVIFTEYQSDVTLFYQSMDVFALVSAREAFGLVLAEAMLNRLPVLATRVGGMKYIVDDNETGFLVEKYDISGIVEKIELLYQNKELRVRMGAKGYIKAVNEYTENVYVRKVEKLYNEVYVHFKKIEIGKNCLIAANTQIVDSNGHLLSFENPSNRINTQDDGKEIVIEDNVWIGTGCIILGGTIIGSGSVVAAGSVVNGIIPPNSLCGGNPIKIIKQFLAHAQ